MEAIYFYSGKLPASLNSWYGSFGLLCETLFAWKSAMELAGAKASSVGDSGTGGGRTLLFETGITLDTEKSRSTF